MIEKLFISYKIAKELKSIGFDEECLAKWMLDIVGDSIPHFRYNYENEGLWYKHNSKDLIELNGNYDKDFLWAAPLYQQAINWIREKGIYITILNEHKLLSKCFYAELKYSRPDVLNKGKYYQVKTQVYPNWDRGVDETGTYNEALDKAIEEAINLIKTDKMIKK